MFLSLDHISIIIVEDNLVQLNKLNNIVSTLFPDYSIYSCNSLDEAFSICLKNKIDLFLLDIEVNDELSIDFISKLKKSKNYSDARVIFISAYSKYALKAIQQCSCFDYILKPYTKNDIKSSILKCLSYEYRQLNSYDYFQISINRIPHRINKNNILYLESVNRKIIIYSVKSKIVIPRNSLKKLLLELNKYTSKFIQCHRSYIVNKDFINDIVYDSKNRSSPQILLKNDETIPIGVIYKKALISSFYEQF